MINPLFMMMQSNRHRTLNSNPFLNRSFSFYGNNFPPYDDEDDSNLLSLQSQNDYLRNYQIRRRDEMIEEKQCLNAIYSSRNKLRQLENIKKENMKKLFNTIEQYKNEEKIETEKYASELKNLIDNKKNETLKKKNYLNYLEKKIENQKKLNNKKKVQR